MSCETLSNNATKINDYFMNIFNDLDAYENIPRPWELAQHEAEEIAFSRCAVEEILQLVWDRPWTLASDTIENFALKMDSYKDSSVTDEQKRVFSVLAETAWEILQEIEPLEQ